MGFECPAVQELCPRDVEVVVGPMWEGSKVQAWTPRASAWSWAGEACEDERGPWERPKAELTVGPK